MPRVDELYLIAGLGNPGREYERTRHNAGFLVAERLAADQRAAWSTEDRFQARVCRIRLSGCTVLLCEPLTYMNASGEAVGRVLKYYRVPVDRLLVVVDDADLPLGEIRLRGSGSSGGHHGLESVESHIGTRDYARLRVGIGRRSDGRRDIAGYVLGRFGSDEEPVLERVLVRCARQIECWATRGVAVAMSQFNGTVSPDNTKATE
jgi:PTH1 family peptidyl-tRNA hydrolase